MSPPTGYGVSTTLLPSVRGVRTSGPERVRTGVGGVWETEDRSDHGGPTGTDHHGGRDPRHALFGRVVTGNRGPDDRRDRTYCYFGEPLVPSATVGQGRVKTPCGKDESRTRTSRPLRVGSVSG